MTSTVLAELVQGAEQRLLIHTPHTSLEGHLRLTGRPDGIGVLILHPYALLGGSMNDHVVCELFRAAAGSPAVSAVLRYNQRGVGRSGGSRSVRLGREDTADVLDLVEFLAAQLPGPAPRIAVVGYSWGACLGAYGLVHPAVAAYVGVSFPLGGISFLLQTKKHMQQLCSQQHVPRLLVLGTDDQFTRASALQEVVLEAGGCLLAEDDSFAPLGQAAGGGSPAAAGAAAAAAQQRAAQPAAAHAAAPPPQQQGGAGLPGGRRQLASLLLRFWPGSVDHFWMDEASRMAEYVVGWLEVTLAPPPPAAGAR